MLMQMYRNLTASSQAIHDLNERVLNRNLTASSQAIHDLNERVLTYMLGNNQPSTINVDRCRKTSPSNPACRYSKRVSKYCM